MFRPSTQSNLLRSFNDDGRCHQRVPCTPEIGTPEASFGLVPRGSGSTSTATAMNENERNEEYRVPYTPVLYMKPKYRKSSSQNEVMQAVPHTPDSHKELWGGNTGQKRSKVESLMHVNFDILDYAEISNDCHCIQDYAGQFKTDESLPPASDSTDWFSSIRTEERPDMLSILGLI